MQSFSCFVINLDKDTERLSFMRKQLSDLDIEYTRLTAVPAKILPNSELEKIYNKELSEELNTIPLNKGEIGCAASHIAIYKKIVANKIPYTLVLEDDVQLSKNLKEILLSQTEKHKMCSHFEYLHLDYFAYGFEFFKIWFPGIYSILLTKKGVSRLYFFILLCLKFLTLLPLLAYEEVSKRLFKNSALSPVRDMYFAGAYLVTLRGAEKLISFEEKVVYTADRLPNIIKRKEGLCVKIYTPLLAKQLKNAFPSNLKLN